MNKTSFEITQNYKKKTFSTTNMFSKYQKLKNTVLLFILSQSPELIGF